MRGVQEAREKLPALATDDLAVPALRDRRDHDRVHQAGRGGGHAQRPRRLQRLPPAALGGPRHHHRLVPRRRDRPAQHQPAAPDLAQGAHGGAAHGRRPSRTSTSAARSPSATCSPTSTPPRASAARSTRRCGPATTSRRCGSTCSPATSTGSSATTPAARTSRSSATRGTTLRGEVRLRWRGVPAARPGRRGRRRGLSYRRIAAADLAGTRPQRYGLPAKGDIARRATTPDFCLVDPVGVVDGPRGGLRVDPGVHARSRASSSAPGSPTPGCGDTRSCATARSPASPSAGYLHRPGTA